MIDNTNEYDDVVAATRAETVARSGSTLPWGLRLAFGIFWLVLGVAAINVPVGLTLTTALFLGWILIISGIIQSIHAIFTWKDSGALQFVSGIIFLLFGLFLVNNLFAGVVTITSLMGIFFFIEGVLQLVMAFADRSNMALYIFGGIISILFSVLILSNLLGASLLLIGLLLGIHMIFRGFGMIAQSTFSDQDPGTGQKILGAIVFGFIIIFFLARAFDWNEPPVEAEGTVEKEVISNFVEAEIGSILVYSSTADEVMLAGHCSLNGGTFNVCGPTACQIASKFDSALVCAQVCAPVCIGVVE